MNKYFLNKEDTLLLMIDVQERLLPVMNQKDMLLGKLSSLLKSFNELGIPMIVTEQYPKGLGKTSEQLKNDINGPVFDKLTFSAFRGEIKEAIEKSGKNSVVVAGIESHICVFQTVRDLLDNGYHVFVLADASSSREEENHKNGLAQMKDMGAVITNLETVLFDLLKEAGTNEFKVISNYIK